MPKRYPPKFKRDVVHVARTAGLTHAQIAEDFGISEHSARRLASLRPLP
jgi:transposase